MFKHFYLLIYLFHIVLPIKNERPLQYSMLCLQHSDICIDALTQPMYCVCKPICFFLIFKLLLAEFGFQTIFLHNHFENSYYLSFCLVKFNTSCKKCNDLVRITRILRWVCFNISIGIQIEKIILFYSYLPFFLKSQ